MDRRPPLPSVYSILLQRQLLTGQNPIALEKLQWKYYFCFLAVQIYAIVIIYFTFPETKGRMLEEIAVIFDGESARLPAESHLQEEHEIKKEAAHVENNAGYDNEKAA